MIDKPIIEKKLRKIEDFLRELKNVEIPTMEEFTSNIVFIRFIERNIELAIEQMIDICRHLVSDHDLAEPETYSDCFDILAKEGVIIEQNLLMCKAMIRFRNKLIHVYDGIDDSITFGIYKHRLNDFRVFINEIRAYLIKD